MKVMNKIDVIDHIIKLWSIAEFYLCMSDSNLKILLDLSELRDMYTEFKVEIKHRDE